MTLVDRWLDWLQHDRGRSANTISTYRRTIRTLPNIETVTREEVEAWWRTRSVNDKGEPRPHSARNNELSAIRSYSKWAMRFDHRPDDPTIRLDLLSKKRRMSRFINNADLTTMLATFPPELRRAVALGAYAGTRVSEAANLDWADINEESRLIIVRGKGDQERNVRASVTLLDILLPNTGGNVVTAGNGTYANGYLQAKVNAAIKRAGIVGTFHKLRHRYGYKCAEAGIAATSIAAAMGHQSLQTTMGYIAAMDSDLDLIAEAVTR